ncbi:MAG: hypothetical protein ACRBI6_19095 [Acidimicrobiales bacterium]
MRIHQRRDPWRSGTIRFAALLAASIGAVTACGASSETTAPGTATTTVAETTVTEATVATTATTTVEFDYQQDPVLAELPAMFDDYATMVSQGDEGAAYDRYAGPILQSRITRDDFIEGNSTSTIHDLVVYRAFWLDVEQTTAEAWVVFTSFQGADFGPDGQTCTVWDLTYTMLRDGGTWMIQAATNGPESPTPC